jgi:hypothetical protein
MRKDDQRKFLHEPFGRFLYLGKNALLWCHPPMVKPIKCYLCCPDRISELCRGAMNLGSKNQNGGGQ